jgi:hypothetical protein
MLIGMVGLHPRMQRDHRCGAESMKYLTLRKKIFSPPHKGHVSVGHLKRGF